MNYPNGVYIAFNLSRETEENIKKYCEENLPDMEMNEDLHCTLVYSKKPHEPRIKRDHCRCSGKPKKFSIFGEDDKSLVLEIDSEELKKMNHEKMKEHDFVSDFDEYKPHVTFVYG